MLTPIKFCRKTRLFQDSFNKRLVVAIFSSTLKVNLPTSYESRLQYFPNPRMHSKIFITLEIGITHHKSHFKT
jgi:hypothetical protein